MGINIRTKGANGEREVATAMNGIIETVLKAHNIPLPPKPVIQRNQNQSAVGGSDLTNPFGLAIEVKRQEQLSINTWWTQCLNAAAVHSEIPVLVYRKNSQKWSVVMMTEVPLWDGTLGVRCRCEISWNDFLQWFYVLVDRKVRQAEFGSNG